MLEIINGIMSAFQISEQELFQKQTIPTPIGQTLYWDYYCYVKEHPVSRWNTPTQILSGGKDTLCSSIIVASPFPQNQNITFMPSMIFLFWKIGSITLSNKTPEEIPRGFFYI